MIQQQIPISSQMDFSKKENQYIWLIGHRSCDLLIPLQDLYKSTSQLNRSIYGTKLYRQNSGQMQNQKQSLSKNKKQSVGLQREQLLQKTKNYISWCYFLLNWQSVSLQNLSIFLDSLPRSEQEIQSIRIQGCLLKFSKNDKALVLNIASQDIRIQQNKYYFDSYDRQGKGQMLQYGRSLCKISIGSISYRFNGLIRIVQSCQGFAAISTKQSIYIISLKHNNGTSMKFDISQTIDMKWGKRGLYYLQSNGTLGLLQKQTTFIQKFNSFSQNMTIELGNTIQRQYIPQRIAITGNNQINNNLIIMASSASNSKRLVLQVLDSSRYGMIAGSMYNLDLKEVSGEVLYKNLVYVRGEIRVIGVSGWQGKIDKYWQYRFGAA